MIFNMQTIFVFEVILFVATILMHVVKRNSTIIAIYLFQSLALVGLLGIHAYQEQSIGSFLIALLVFVIKVLIAPRFFFRLINRSHQNLSASTYINVPMTLGVIVGLIFLSQSDIFSPLGKLLGETQTLRMMLISSVFISLFLTINRKGVLSQIIGVLSLENSIVAFGFFIGLRQPLNLELGILFDILIWVIISTVFVSMIYKQFDSYDVTRMKHLKEE